MDDVFILNPAADQLDITDAINERLQKAKAITQCLLASHNVELELSRLCVYDLVWAVDDYLSEISFLQGRISNQTI